MPKYHGVIGCKGCGGNFPLILELGTWRTVMSFVLPCI